MRSNSTYIITIDGTSGSGKTTISKSLAKKLGFSLLDSGKLYRSAGFVYLQSKESFSDSNNIKGVISKIIKESNVVSNEFEIFLEIMQQFFSRLCKTGAMQKPVLPSVTENEAKIMKNLCPNLKSAHFWSEAANITLAKLNKGYLLNIDIDSLILDAFIYLEKSYQTIYRTRITNE